jgi:hypothetical protein
MELKHLHSDDLDEILVAVEKSFDFSFGKTELKQVKTFGELCDVITAKVQGDNSNDCTTQQAFYKIRSVLSATLFIDKNQIMPGTCLQQLFPRQGRRQKIEATESLLGLKTRILRPKHWITGTFALALIASLFGLAFFWKIALSLLAFAIIGLVLAGKFGKELDLKTVAQLAEKISRENYLRARRNPSTVNRNEIAQKVKELFTTN